MTGRQGRQDGDAGHKEHSGSSCCQGGCSGRCSGESGSSSKDVLAHLLLLTGGCILVFNELAFASIGGLIAISSSAVAWRAAAAHTPFGYGISGEQRQHA